MPDKAEHFAKLDEIEAELIALFRRRAPEISAVLPVQPPASGDVLTQLSTAAISALGRCFVETSVLAPDETVSVFMAALQFSAELGLQRGLSDLASPVH